MPNLRKEVILANPLTIVQQFQQALGKGDFTAARHLLHDNLSFRGPIDTFHEPEPYLEALKKLQPITQRIDILKMFADGNDVCVLCDVVTNTPIGTAFICEWYQVKAREDSGRPHRVRRASIRCDVREIGSPEGLSVADRAYFGPGLLRFLKDLRLHNEREWFLTNQQRYEMMCAGHSCG